MQLDKLVKDGRAPNHLLGHVPAVAERYRPAISRHSRDVSVVYGYRASLLTYMSACNPEVKTKCPARNAPTFCKTSSTCASSIIQIILQRRADCAMKGCGFLPRTLCKVRAVRGKDNGT